jgi:hypothetical protein
MGKLPDVVGNDDTAHNLVETGTEAIASGNLWQQLGVKAMAEDHDESTAHRPVAAAAAAAAAAGVCMVMIV